MDSSISKTRTLITGTLKPRATSGYLTHSVEYSGNNLNASFVMTSILRKLGYAVESERTNNTNKLTISWRTPTNKKPNNKPYIYYFTDKQFTNFVCDNKITYNNTTYIGETSLNAYEYNTVVLNSPITSTLSSNFWFTSNTKLPSAISFIPNITNDKFNITAVKYSYNDYDVGTTKTVNGTLSSLNNIPLTAYMQDLNEKYNTDLSEIYKTSSAQTTVNVPSNITFSNIQTLVKANDVLLEANKKNVETEKNGLQNKITGINTKYENAKPQIKELTVVFNSVINSKLTTANLQVGRKMLF
jgi:hypothetical protein